MFDSINNHQLPVLVMQYYEPGDLAAKSLRKKRQDGHNCPSDITTKIKLVRMNKIPNLLSMTSPKFLQVADALFYCEDLKAALKTKLSLTHCSASEGNNS